MFIIQALWFILPAGISNMAPVLFKRTFKSLDIPLDFGKKYRGKRILGDHKTVRGYLAAIIIAIIIAGIQALLYFYTDFFKSWTIFPFHGYNFIIFGILSGLGAMVGDSVESFFKRQCNVAPGGKFIPWDQVDFVIGALVFISFYFRPNWGIYAFLIIIIPLFHILINHIGFWIGINKSKW